MPHAIITTNSRSLDRRPRPTSRPISSAIGMVSASACGSSVAVSWRIVTRRHALGDHRLGQIDDEGDNQDEREDEQREQERRDDLPDHVPVDDARHSFPLSVTAAADGTELAHGEAGPALAHAPAVLRGPRHRRAHPAVGTAPRHQGLLGHGGDARGVSGASGSPSTWCRRWSGRSRRLPRSAPGIGTSSSG